MRRNAVNTTIGVALSAVCATAASAQQITGTLGSPGAHRHHQRKAVAAARPEIPAG